ncbi:copper-binding protein [Acidovorax sp. A1169]|uniref:copper-binding protein n=1 Tax=Acidovorax sp. A1169 TaxID=3059524 RepID=UPI002737CDD5|nr:copper-binding protein [Acidovorax sp. A1169]
MAMVQQARCLALAGVAAAALVVCSALAQPAVPAQADGQAAPVLTRARVVSVQQEPGGPLYVRLKLLPRAKLPFTTQRFTVVDRTLLAGIAEGAWVKFTAKSVDGENTLTSIQVAEECKRFQPCD